MMRAAFAALLLAGVAQAQPAPPAAPAPERLIAALSQNSIAITAAFDGSEIFIYGAVARSAAIDPDSGQLGVVVRVAGPAGPLIVRRKARVFGIWANVDAERIRSAPSFYAVAATGPLEEILSHTEDLRWRVSLGNALRFVGAISEDRGAFLDAVERIRARQGLYDVQPGGVTLVEDTLFSASFELPANIVEGDYAATVFLTRDGAVIDVFETEIEVAKAGVERWLYDLARNQPYLYGLMALAVALCAGLAASEAFRYLRR